MQNMCDICWELSYPWATKCEIADEQWQAARNAEGSEEGGQKTRRQDKMQGDLTELQMFFALVWLSDCYALMSELGELKGKFLHAKANQIIW